MRRLAGTQWLRAELPDRGVAGELCLPRGKVSQLRVPRPQVGDNPVPEEHSHFDIAVQRSLGQIRRCHE